MGAKEQNVGDGVVVTLFTRGVRAVAERLRKGRVARGRGAKTGCGVLVVRRSCERIGYAARILMQDAE